MANVGFSTKVQPSNSKTNDDEYPKQQPLSPIDLDAETINHGMLKNDETDWKDVLFSEAPLDETNGNTIEMRSIL